MLRIGCSEIWGGIRDHSEDVQTSGIVASLHSGAADGGKGGDIYYVSVCDSGLLTRVALADVLGHGQVVADTGQWLYRALAERMNDTDGAGILAQLNRLCDVYGYRAMTTAAVFAFYRADSNLYVAYAGHPPLLIRRRAGGRWEPAELAGSDHAANLPLGVDVEAVYDQEAIPLSRGDRLFLYTDGVIEAPDRRGALFGVDRLIEVLQGIGDRDLPEIRAGVLDRLGEHTGGPLGHDDVTLMAIEIL